MATLWHYQTSTDAAGPVSFRTLIELVRDGKLSADDLVREEWNSDWRPAALAVGLFHMAGRDDLFDQWQAEQERLAKTQEELDDLLESAPDHTDEPSWQKRFREVEAQRRQAAAENASEQELASVRQDAQEAIAAWEEEQDRKQQQAGGFLHGLGEIFSQETYRRLFPWGIGLIAANITAYAIMQWSETQSLRFPSAIPLEHGIRQFPVWGECTDMVYFILLTDAMLLTGIVGFVLGRILVSMAD